MSHPSWPFEHAVDGTWQPPAPDEYEDRDGFEPHGKPAESVVYLVEGTQLGYGTKQAWEESQR
jgi:hypothetical protein